MPKVVYHLALLQASCNGMGRVGKMQTSELMLDLYIDMYCDPWPELFKHGMLTDLGAASRRAAD